MELKFIPDEVKELSKYRLEKAKFDLESAKILLDNNLFAQSLNRSYYSIFHSVRALLAYDKFDSKKHSGIISFFQQNYIKTLKFQKEFSLILTSAERIRIESDYDDFYLAAKEDAENQSKNAELFLTTVKDFIRNNYHSLNE